MSIQRFTDSTSPDDYYDVSVESMDQIKAIVEHIVTDGALITPELIIEAKDVLKKIEDK